MNCSGLTSLIIPNSVTRIETAAFYGCSKLTRVTFNNKNSWKAGSTTISSSDLQKPAIAAQYLTDTYYGYIWKHS